jgi:hercynine metabolism protein
MSSDNWLEQLEARLEQQLEGFLRDNPQQQVLLEQQAARDQQQRLGQERLELRQRAESQRRALLSLAEEIRLWQQRVERARQANAGELAERAERHLAALMEQGRGLWQSLAELGVRFGQVEAELAALASKRKSTANQPGSQPGRAVEPPAAGATTSLDGDGAGTASDDLEAAWARFETQQDLQELRRRLRL